MKSSLIHDPSTAKQTDEVYQHTGTVPKPLATARASYHISHKDNADAQDSYVNSLDKP